MGKWVELVGRTVGVVIDAETEMVAWTPSHAGRIKRVGVLPGGIAATTLIENGYIKLSSSKFGGVDMLAPFDGGGLATAPRGQRDIQWTECDLQAEMTPIRVAYYHNVIPTTPEITVFAEMEG
jgi:hypothetical protein